jgi:hypothetical protein
MMNQQLGSSDFGTPAALLGWMGCIQAQDFGQAKWSIGVRGAAVSEARVDEDFNDGRILRTHVLRPTWHFVLPSDIRWMLQLTAPRIRQFCQPYYKRLELDARVFNRARKVLEKSLRDGKPLMRAEIGEEFRRVKINTDDIRMNFLLMDAELDGLICSGPRRGKQFTYALLDERAPLAPGVSQVGALTELAIRYFRSRGPATAADFAWWSGLTAEQAKKGLEMVKAQLEKVTLEGKEFWFGAESSAAAAVPPVFFLPAFDEFMVAYKDRAHALPGEQEKITSQGLKAVVVVNGRVAGSWKRTVRRDGIELEVPALEGLSKKNYAAAKKEARRYAEFAGGKLVLFRS